MEDNKSRESIRDCINIKCKSDLYRATMGALWAYSVVGPDAELRKLCEEFYECRLEAMREESDRRWANGEVKFRVTPLRSGYDAVGNTPTDGYDWYGDIEMDDNCC